MRLIEKKSALTMLLLMNVLPIRAQLDNQFKLQEEEKNKAYHICVELQFDAQWQKVGSDNVIKIDSSNQIW